MNRTLLTLSKTMIMMAKAPQLAPQKRMSQEQILK